METTVEELLKGKPREVFSVPPQVLIYDALRIMADRDIGAVLVIENDKLVGIFSERDYARKVILKGKSSRETRVSDIMTTKLYYVRPESTLGECMYLITNQKIRHLPVLSKGRVTGIITIGDVVKKIIYDKDTTISHLEEYILGTYY